MTLSASEKMMQRWIPDPSQIKHIRLLDTLFNTVSDKWDFMVSRSHSHDAYMPFRFGGNMDNMRSCLPPEGLDAPSGISGLFFASCHSAGDQYTATAMTLG